MKKNYSNKNSPSLPLGFSAAAAKHFGHDAFKSISLWCGIPFLKRIEGTLLFCILSSFAWLNLAVSAAGIRKMSKEEKKKKNTKRTRNKQKKNTK